MPRINALSRLGRRCRLLLLAVRVRFTATHGPTPAEQLLRLDLTDRDVQLGELRQRLAVQQEAHEAETRLLRRDLAEREDKIVVLERGLKEMALAHEATLARTKAEIAVYGDVIARARGRVRGPDGSEEPIILPRRWAAGE